MVLVRKICLRSAASLLLSFGQTQSKHSRPCLQFAVRHLHEKSQKSRSFSALGQPKFQSEIKIHSTVPSGPHATKIIFSDHQTCDFKFIWLRDNCRCSDCVHPETNQKLLDTPTLDVNIRPRSVTIGPDNELIVEWPTASSGAADGGATNSGNSHRSVFSPAWLHRHGQCFAQDSFEVAAEAGSLRPPLELWDRTTIWNRFPEISFREVMDSEEGLKTWLEMVHKYGIAVIRGVPTDTKNEIIRVVNRFAYVKETSYGLIFDVLSVPDPKTHLANTGLRLELHTDMNYREKSPGLQLLHCLQANDPGSESSGGRSFFADGFHAAKWLQLNQPAAFHVLSSTPIKFSITTKNLKYSQHWPVLCTDKDGDMTEIHYNNRTMGPLQAPTHLVLAFYHAYQLFTEKLRDPGLELQFQMLPGDMVAFNNRRVLHGRTTFDPRKVNRHLQGCYVDIDEAMSRYDLLLSK